MCCVDRTGLHEFYRMSYMWYGAYAVVSCVLIGLVISALIQRKLFAGYIPRERETSFV